MSNIMDKIIIDAPSKKLEDAMRNKIERYVKEQEEEGTDNLMDKYRDVGMSPSDFISEG